MATFYPDGVEPPLSDAVKTAQQWAELSRDWAIKLGDTVDGVDFSSKYWALDSKDEADRAKSEADRAQSIADGISSVELNDLTDVTLVNPTVDQALIFDGLRWVNQNQSGGGGGTNSLAGLSDTTISGVAMTNAVLAHNGTVWYDNKNVQLTTTGDLTLRNLSTTAQGTFNTGIVVNTGNLDVSYTPGVAGVRMNFQGIATIGLEVTEGPATFDGDIVIKNETLAGADWTYNVGEIVPGANGMVFTGSANNSLMGINVKDGAGTTRSFLFNEDGTLTVPTNPSDPQDVVTKAYGDANYGGGTIPDDIYVNITGDNMTGQLTVQGDGQAPDQGGTGGVRLNNFGIATVGLEVTEGPAKLDGGVVFPNESTNASEWTFVVDDFGILNFATFTGSEANSAFGINTVNNIGTNQSFLFDENGRLTVPTDPDGTNDQHVVTKGYADANYGGGGGTNDHSQLINLGADDHPQYLDNARGDARYANIIGDTFTGGVFVQGDGVTSGAGLSNFGVSAFGVNAQNSLQLNGEEILSNTNRNLNNINDVIPDGRVRLQNGTLADAAVGFVEEGNTGMLRVTQGVLGLSTQGALRMQMNANEIDAFEPLNMNTNRITGLADPVNGTDAATRQFVLANAGGGVTDHGALSGLGDDDHQQYLPADGSRASTATLKLPSGIQTGTGGTFDNAFFGQFSGAAVLGYDNSFSLITNPTQTQVLAGGSVQVNVQETSTLISNTLDVADNPIRRVGNPLTGTDAMSRNYADGRYVQQGAGLGPGVAVAGGKIVSDGGGSQSVANCWGVSACSINGDGFRFTLTDAILVDNDMVILATADNIFGGDCTSVITHRVSDSTFDVTVFQIAFNNITLSGPSTVNGVTFYFTVYNAGL